MNLVGKIHVTNKLISFLLALACLVGLPLVAVAQTVQTAPATPAVTAAQPVAAPAQDSGYVLGADDVIDVKVLGQPEFQAGGRIEVDGTVNIQFIGSTMANGQTPLTLSRTIADKLRVGGYYTKPIVTVTVVSFASRYITVLGEVAQPGLLPINRSYRVSEIIARVGGIRPTGAEHVLLRRATGEEMKLDFKTLATGTGDQDPVVLAGDKLYVPTAEIYYIYGQVNQPGAFPIQSEMTLRKALARAGGVTALGSDKRVQVFRNGKPERADLERPIAPGDVVVVGERLF